MTTDPRQEFLDNMVRERGYVLDFHKILVAEDFDFVQIYNQMIDAIYLKQRSLDAKTKELLYTVILTAIGGTHDHIKAHMKLALQYGATKQDLLEALELLMGPAGISRFMHGFEAWKQLVNPETLEPTVQP